MISTFSAGLCTTANQNAQNSLLKIAWYIIWKKLRQVKPLIVSKIREYLKQKKL